MGGTDSEELQAPKGPLGEAQQATSGQSSKTDRKADVTEGANGTIDGSTPQTRRKVASPAATRMCDFGAFSSAPEPAEFDSDGDYGMFHPLPDNNSQSSTSALDCALVVSPSLSLSPISL